MSTAQNPGHERFQAGRPWPDRWSLGSLGGLEQGAASSLRKMSDEPATPPPRRSRRLWQLVRTPRDQLPPRTNWPPRMFVLGGVLAVTGIGLMVVEASPGGIGIGIGLLAGAFFCFSVGRELR